MFDKKMVSIVDRCGRADVVSRLRIARRLIERQLVWSYADLRIGISDFACAAPFSLNITGQFPVFRTKA
jgi:hypothetical protein